MLPLSRDYADLAKNTLGDEAERYGQLAEEVRRRGYAVQVLEA